jgi:hypothetical protein
MRFTILTLLASVLVSAASVSCAAPQPAVTDKSANQTSTPKAKASSGDDGNDPSAAPAPTKKRVTAPTDNADDGSDGVAASPVSDPAVGAVPLKAGNPSAFGCNGAGIAGFADALAVEASKSCTTDGAGVVTDTNYECMRAPIMKLAPPFPDAAFERVEHWAKLGNNYAGKTQLLQCVDFAFIVTAGVCGQPINGGDAQIMENRTMPGYQYMPVGSQPAPGDVLVLDGHIAITAALVPGGIRVAEANCLEPNGSTSQGEDTGFISNTRIDGLTDGWVIGWYRKQ